MHKLYFIDLDGTILHHHRDAEENEIVCEQSRNRYISVIDKDVLKILKSKPEDVVILNLEGEIVDGERKPSSEKDLHIEMYKKFPWVTSVVHTHSMYCTVFACLGMPLKSVHYILADAGTDVVPVTPYKTYGTKELAIAAAESIGDSKATILANHGMLAIGKDIKDAFGVASSCEWIAEIQWRTMAIGTPNILDRDEMEFVMKKFNTYGQVKESK